MLFINYFVVICILYTLCFGFRLRNYFNNINFLALTLGANTLIIEKTNNNYLIILLLLVNYFDHISLIDKLMHLKIQSHDSLMENTCKEIWVRFVVMATFTFVKKIPVIWRITSSYCFTVFPDSGIIFVFKLFYIMLFSLFEFLHIPL